jgi:hypothetical protein
MAVPWEIPKRRFAGPGMLLRGADDKGVYVLVVIDRFIDE